MQEYFLLNQMYILLILFFVSLFSIIFMMGRKLVSIRHDEVTNHDEILLEFPYFKEVKHIVIKNTKKHGYAFLVTVIRWYVQSANFIKNKYNEIKIKIKDRREKNNINGDKKEISKFLKIIGDYKHKIREIKHKIKKEENL